MAQRSIDRVARLTDDRLLGLQRILAHSGGRGPGARSCDNEIWDGYCLSIFRDHTKNSRPPPPPLSDCVVWHNPRNPHMRILGGW
jgi:hypothetical protein